VAHTGERQNRPTRPYHLRARQYDPATGRFAAPDPTGYAANNPATLTDPSGLYWESALDIVAIGYDMRTI